MLIQQGKIMENTLEVSRTGTSMGQQYNTEWNLRILQYETILLRFGNTPEGIAYIKTQRDLPEPDIQLIIAPYFVPVTVPKVPGKDYTVAVIQVRKDVAILCCARLILQCILLSSQTILRIRKIQKLVRAITLVRRLNQTKAFAPFYEGDAHPGPQIQSSKEMVEFIRNNQQTMFHPVGTCKMGHDDLAVVDEQLRVYGVQGLCVVDASIMPTLVNGNTNTPTSMIAE